MRYHGGMRLMPKAEKIFRQNMRAVMQLEGITMEALAVAVGTKQPNISRILSGKEGLSLERAERISLALGSSLRDMLMPSKIFSASA